MAKRVPAVATLLLAIEMLVVLLFLLAVYTTVSALVAARSGLNTVLTAGLEQAALIGTTAGGAYDNVGWDGQGVTVNADALPSALAQTLAQTVPHSTTVVMGGTLTWTLPPAAAAAWRVSGPIVLTQLQATTGPDQSVTLNGQTLSYPMPVLAGVVQLPLRVVSGFGVTWRHTLTEAVVLPLAGRAGPAGPTPFATP
ncbi:MAG: hypothetical protein OWV35_05510 [Firmicutes bacterium]|nr:hypothetical protein [Bacillota bacterium]